MRALYKTPNDQGFREIIVPNKLEPIQKLVGGHIESVTMAEDAAILCNEEGKVIGMPYNCEYLGIDFNGTILIVGVDGDEFTDCPWSVTMADGGIVK